MDERRRTIATSPHMEPSGKKRLAELMSLAKVYMEFGAGGSTMMAGEYGVPIVLSTESDLAFCDQLRSEFNPRYFGTTLIALHTDLGPTKVWGYPTGLTKSQNWPQYVLRAWRFAGEMGHLPDIVLVDGRFRVACMLASLLFGKEGTPVLVDDYVGRPYAMVVEKFAAPVALHGRMAEFRIPARDSLALSFLVSELTEAYSDPE